MYELHVRLSRVSYTTAMRQQVQKRLQKIHLSQSIVYSMRTMLIFLSYFEKLHMCFSIIGCLIGITFISSAEINTAWKGADRQQKKSQHDVGNAPTANGFCQIFNENLPYLLPVFVHVNGFISFHGLLFVMIPIFVPSRQHIIMLR